MTPQEKIIADLKDISNKYMTILQSNVIPKSVLDMYIEHLEGLQEHSKPTNPMPQTLTDKIVEAVKEKSVLIQLQQYVDAKTDSEKEKYLSVFDLTMADLRSCIDKVIGEQVKIDERNMNNFRSFLKGYFDDQGRVDDIELGFNLAFYNPPKPADDGK